MPQVRRQRGRQQGSLRHATRSSSSTQPTLPIDTRLVLAYSKGLSCFGYAREWLVCPRSRPDYSANALPRAARRGSGLPVGGYSKATRVRCLPSGPPAGSTHWDRSRGPLLMLA